MTPELAQFGRRVGYFVAFFAVMLTSAALTAAVLRGFGIFDFPDLSWAGAALDAELASLGARLSADLIAFGVAVGQILEVVVGFGIIIGVIGLLIAIGETSQGAVSIADVTTGAEFERYCARVLRDAGWDVEETRGSGDHGVDLIAKRSRLRVAIQCKFHEKAVGNRAVLEVVGGARHYRADATAVVSKSGYTPMAEELARSNGTLLVAHYDLGSLTRRLSLQ